MQYLHENNVCHRDIKPQNVIVTKDLRLKLIDFNISKQNFDNFIDEQDGDLLDARLKFYTQISSPMFSAPEVSSQPFYTEKIDIWGVGVIAIYMLTDPDIIEAIDIHVEENHISRLLDALADGKLCSDSIGFIRECLKVSPGGRPSVEGLLSHSYLRS